MTAPQPTAARLLREVDKTRSILDRSRKATEAAQSGYRKALAAAVDGGISMSELARQLRTSPAHIREQVLVGRADRSR